jgi:hypothetical protein
MRLRMYVRSIHSGIRRPHTAPAALSPSEHEGDTQDAQYCTVQTDFGEIQWPVTPHTTAPVVLMFIAYCMCQ